MAIIHMHVGASDSNLYLDKVFGRFYMPSTALELAAKLLVDVLEPLENLEVGK